MAMQFSLAHLTAMGCAPPELVYIAADAGYDFVSPRTIMTPVDQGYNYDLASNKAMLRDTRRALDETGLKVHDIELVRIVDGVDIATFRPAFEVAAALGARYVIASIWTPDRAFATESFAELCDVANVFGLRVSLEFVTWANVVNLREVTAILAAADRDNAGILIDTLHFHRSRVRLEELDAVPPEQFAFVHLCDAPEGIPETAQELIQTGRAERLYLGEGGIDIAAILARMPEVPYSLEIPNAARVKELGYAAHVRRCLETAKQYLACHAMQAASAASDSTSQPALPDYCRQHG